MENEEKVLEECTFTPNIHKLKDDSRYILFNNIIEIHTRSNSAEVSKRLYSHAMNKLLRIKSIYEEQKSLDNSCGDFNKECTFSPVVGNLYIYLLILS